MKITKSDKIFTIGSCFAYEVQTYLANNGYNVLNRTIERDPAEPALIWYNTFTIAYEFDRITGAFAQDKEDIWETARGWQDPYRRLLFAPSRETLWRKIVPLDTDIKRCIQEAKVFIITLGLTEVFFQDNDRAICATPGYGGGGGEGTRFAATRYEQNIQNICRVIHAIGNRHLILTVSPVPLAKTFTTQPVHVANCESKSILRAAAGYAARTNGNVTYFPSYEMALEDPKTVYREDGRHVTPAFVNRVMTTFEESFCR